MVVGERTQGVWKWFALLRLKEPCNVKQVLYPRLPIKGYVEPGNNIHFRKLVYKQGFLENVLILKNYLHKALFT